MQRVLSTYRYIRQSLNASLLAEISRGGIKNIEVWCAHPHFNYAEPQAIRELASGLEEYGLALHSLHAPTQRDLAPGRESGFPISISDPERVRRIDAVDEVKRALEVAERIPFRYLILHISNNRQASDGRSFDAAFNSLEHLVVFAKNRGVTIAVENTPGEFGSAASLQQFIKETHLKDLRYCFDIGHAHIDTGVAASLELMRGRIVTTHLHDNHGEKDEHLLPGEGTVDWEAAMKTLRANPEELPLVLELKEKTGGDPSLDKVCEAFDKLEETAERAVEGA
ncbi:MAG: sugar phosphate isomerase/epimerase family protein [Candidatus Acidiferrales bacterium]